MTGHPGKPTGRKQGREKRVGTVQFDVDDLWVYYESIGRTTPPDAEAAAFTQGIPRLLDLFDRYGTRDVLCLRRRPAGSATGSQGNR